MALEEREAITGRRLLAQGLGVLAVVVVAFVTVAIATPYLWLRYL